MSDGRCYFVTEGGERSLIPGCIGVAVNFHRSDAEALAFCTCLDEFETRRMIRIASRPAVSRDEGPAVVAHGDGSNRTVALRPKQDRRRRKCWCGAKRTHIGLSNGVALTDGCEWHVRQWAALAPAR